MIIGYCRVSTDGQSLDAQQAALKAAGADRVFSEKISGARPESKPPSRLCSLLPASVKLPLCVGAERDR